MIYLCKACGNEEKAYARAQRHAYESSHPRIVFVAKSSPRATRGAA